MGGTHPGSRCLTRLLAMVALALGLVVVSACGSGAATTADAAPATDAAPLEDGGTPQEDAAPDEVEIVIFHTGDEHGWLEPWTSSETGVVYGGAANLRARLLATEGFDPEQHLLLSSGDNWTGPAISTWFEGEPVVAAFNLMGYHATTMGNHEIDFGFDVLDQRLTEANFSMLAANVTDVGTGTYLPRMVPYELFDVQGVTVGVLGLLTPGAERDVQAQHEGELAFASLAETLDNQVPAMRDAGAEVVVVLAHECGEPLVLALNLSSVSVDVAFGGHCHTSGYAAAGRPALVFSGAYFRRYSVVTLTYSRAAGQVVANDVRQELVAYDPAVGNPVTPDSAMETLVAGWRTELDAALGEEIGYTATGITHGTWGQANWATDAWLWAFPTADLAIQNFGGLRAAVDPGTITPEDIMTMMPFGNTILMLELTGAQVVANLEAYAEGCVPGSGCPIAVAGFRYIWDGDSVAVYLEGGAPIDPAATYQVLTSDYLYGGAGGFLFAQHDPDPWMTEVSYRQPVIDWTAAQGTSESMPLETLLDGTPRNE